MACNVVILGGGAVGLETARRLVDSRLDAEVTVVDPAGLHVYQPLLPEVASGSLEPRHAVAPLRAVLPTARVIDGEAVSLTEPRTVDVRAREGPRLKIPFDHLVVAPGAVTRVMPVPGLVEAAVGFQTVAETLHLRDRVLERMQLAEASSDGARRRRALTFVFVGGGYSGVEAAGELHDMATAACSQFRGIRPDELRFVLVEASDAILTMVDGRLRQAAADNLTGRGIDLRLSTSVEKVDRSMIELSDGDSIAADTLVWCAGARPTGLAAELGLPVNDDGAALVEHTLQVVGHREVWAAGDGAQVPDLVKGGVCPGSAQYAVRQGRQIARNIERVESGRDPEPFRYRQIGEMITLGRGAAVGYLGPVHLTGWPAWLLRAAYHVVRFPTFRRKARVAVDWTVNAVFPREITSLGMTTEPQAPLEIAEEVAESSVG